MYVVQSIDDETRIFPSFGDTPLHRRLTFASSRGNIELHGSPQAFKRLSRQVMSLVRNDKPQWSSVWPTEPGHYWMHSFGKTRICVVHHCRVGVARVVDGAFCHPQDHADALFLPADMPEVPA